MCQHGLRKGAQVVGQLVDCLHERKRSGAAVVSPFALQSALRANGEIPHDHLYRLVRADINQRRNGRAHPFLLCAVSIAIPLKCYGT
jgi:hypothetical protein